MLVSSVLFYDIKAELCKEYDNDCLSAEIAYRCEDIIINKK